MRFASCLYLPSLTPTAPSARRWKHLLQAYPPEQEFYLFTDEPAGSEDAYWETAKCTLIRLAPIGPFRATVGTQGTRPADRYAYWIFVAVLAEMLRREVDWFYYLEYDCWLNANWEKSIVSELAEQPQALIGGTPIIWYPWQHGDTWSQRIIEFAYAVQRKTGRVLQLEGAMFGPWGTSLYPNGALALYRPAVVQACFTEALAQYPQPQSGFNQELWAIQQHTFDLRIGITLTQQYGLELLERFLVTRSAYSTYAAYRATEATLHHLLTCGFSAVHPVKAGVC